MACMRLGSKADMFHLEGQSWMCTTGLPSDVCIVVEEISFHLHKFPLSSRSQLLEKLIQGASISQTSEEEKKCALSLHDFPGGPKSFLLIAKFCYGIKIEITAADVVSLRCAAEYLQMTEDYGEGNLISQTVNFFDEVLESWLDTVKALQTCEAVLPLSEELHIISRCIDSLATKACSDPTLFNALWNGIHSTAKTGPPMEDWWYDDVAILKLPLFKRLILAVGSKGMMVKGLRCHQRALIEEIITLLPNQKGATPTNFLLRILRTSMILHASSSCREILERRIGAQLDQAVLQDLLIPNTGYSVETLYDIDCVQRIVNHFLFVDQEDDDSDFGESQLVEGSHSFTPMTTVANLLDDYLAEVAPDVNLKFEKFMLLAAAIPDNARPLDDGIYRAIDIYLKAHELPEVLIRSQHTRSSERAATITSHRPSSLLEQLRLRTSVAGWFFISDNLDNSQNLSGNIAQGNDHNIPEGGQIITFDDMRERVYELEKECRNMKHDMEKLVKTKRISWNNFYKRFGMRFGAKSFDLKSVLLACNGDALQPSRKAVLNRKQDPQSKLVD
ncbi:hypothetical protein DH2020_010608 [Rehmannia glutinosa]|uniref:BTB/POZ domain-containing protein n=1 Tax=Rehmannia glutinosa TaxID=99300 RepID=A0ABR0XB15_REHGL